MLLVTGGWNNDWEVTGDSDSYKESLTSTELYRPSAGKWREVPGGALPRPMHAVRVVTLKNKVLLFGDKIILLDYIDSLVLLRWQRL